MKTWRMYMAHRAELPPRLHRTNRTFKAKTREAAMKKALKFAKDAQLHALLIEVRLCST